SLRASPESTEPPGVSTLSRRRAQLAAELVAPVATPLARVVRLWIVPDGPLFQLPFGILPDPVSGRFLFEDRLLAKALTVGVAETPAAPSPSGPAGPRSILAVGDPEL